MAGLSERKRKPYDAPKHSLSLSLYDSNDSLRLTLSPPGSRSRSEDTSETSLQPYDNEKEWEHTTSQSSHHLCRSSSSGVPKEQHIPASYPWATYNRCGVRSFEWLMINGITGIYGDASCRRCNSLQIMEVNLPSSFYRLRDYFLSNKDTMYARAPEHWTNPRLLDCRLCLQTNCVKPNISTKKRNVNWLYLLLTERLGLCTLEQLKYFCKHNRRHRTGAKNRVLYLTYVGMLKQLDPSGPYD